MLHEGSKRQLYRDRSIKYVRRLSLCSCCPSIRQLLASLYRQFQYCFIKASQFIRTPLSTFYVSTLSVFATVVNIAVCYGCETGKCLLALSYIMIQEDMAKKDRNVLWFLWFKNVYTAVKVLQNRLVWLMNSRGGAQSLVQSYCGTRL